MIRLLLDTHVLLWALMSPERLSPRVAALLSDPNNVRLVSAVSAWEIATKYRLGKMPGAASLVASYADHLATFRATELPITASHGFTAGSFESRHGDPFDRMLAAQSLLEAVPLVTADQELGQFPIHVIW